MNYEASMFNHIFYFNNVCGGANPRKSHLENACNKLIVCDDQNIQTYGLRYSLLLALENNDLLKAEELIDSLDDSVMKKYFEAEFIAMKLGPKHGMNQVTDFILKNAKISN